MSELTLEEEQAIKDRCQKSNEGRFEGGMTLYDCPVCQKTFCVHCESSWVYKRGTYKKGRGRVLFYLCSYGCTRKYDEIFDKPKKPIVFE